MTERNHDDAPYGTPACLPRSPDELAVLLYQMIDSGTGAAAYYADIVQAVLTLAITAPGGPPLNAAGFLDRLDVRGLQRAWGNGRHPEQLNRVPGRGPAPARHPAAVRHLLGRLGPALDGRGSLADADAWYFILEGTHPDRPGGGTSDLAPPHRPGTR